MTSSSDVHSRMPRIGLWLDTSDLTEITVDSILEGLDPSLIAQ